jgi:hypothetical protein
VDVSTLSLPADHIKSSGSKRNNLNALSKQWHMCPTVYGNVTTKTCNIVLLI